jgi:GNAT superfamily N-acetyltransferase
MSDTAAVRLTPATPADIPLLLQLIRELADYEQLAHDLKATEANLAAALFGPDRIVHAVVATVDGEPAGYMLFLYNFSTFLAQPGIYLEDLFVRPAWRRRGIGRALLVELARIAVGRGCGRIEWSVLNWNEPALRTYQAIGATAMTDWTLERLSGDALTALAEGSSGAA